jgi:hypothetical protein
MIHSFTDTEVLCGRSTIDGSIKIVVPLSLFGPDSCIYRIILLLLRTQEASDFRHPSVVITTPRMFSDVHQVVTKYKQCLQERLALRKPEGDMTLFPTCEPLNYLAVDILSPLPRTKK